MLYYSQVLDKFFQTVEECVQAEEVYETELLKKQQETEKKAAQINEVLAQLKANHAEDTELIARYTELVKDRTKSKNSDRTFYYFR